MFVHVILNHSALFMIVPLSCLYTFCHIIPTSFGVFNTFCDYILAPSKSKGKFTKVEQCIFNF